MAPRKITLRNGVRVLLVPQPASLAATVLILVEAGSEYETRRINGISHFLEHMMFKGTAKRPRPGMISEELDSLGAEYNAFTGQEYTGYWAKAEKGKVRLIFELVADLYANPIFNPDEIEKERGVVIEEINMYEDTPARRVQEIFTGVLYGDQPAGWDVAGRKDVISRLKRSDFLKYRGARYVPSATVVVVAGSFCERDVIKDIRDTLSPLATKTKRAKPRTSAPAAGPKAIVKFKESDQTHLVLGVPGFTIFDRRRYALEVLADILGGGMSSRLFRKVRDELGAAYYIRAGVDLFIDHGYFAVSAGVDHKKMEKVVLAILEEMSRLKNDDVGDKELAKIKDHLIGGLILGLETSDELAGFYGSQEVLRRPLTSPEDVAKRIKAVTASEVRNVARALFAASRLNFAAIGPYRDSRQFLKLLRL